MGHHHHHGEPVAPDDRAAESRENRRILTVVLALTGSFMLVEAAGGVWTGSLALLSDAGHMLSDTGALAAALFAARVAARPPTREKTYGYHRAEILVALGNGVVLGAIALSIVQEAVSRIRTPEPVDVPPMLAVAVTGLAVNVLAALLLRRRGRRNLNVRAAFLHVLGDLLGSVGAIIAGLVMILTGWWAADAVVSVFIALIIVVSAWRLIRESVDVLMESPPRHLDVQEVGKALLDMDGVTGVHDLHIWSITSGFPALSVHVELVDAHHGPAFVERARLMLRDRFALEHVTIQVETAPPSEIVAFAD